MGKSKTMSDVLREAIRSDERTIYRLALESGVSQSVLGRFVRGERDITLATADRVAIALGLELRPKSS